MTSDRQAIENHYARADLGRAILAALLAEWTGLSQRVAYCQGDACAMPFQEARFDSVWLQHASLNIADKATLYAQLYRALQPDGRLALYEIVTASGGPPYFPTPWAREPALSFLTSADTLREQLAEAGFQSLVWQDATAPALDWSRRALRPHPDAPPRLGPQVLFGPDWEVISHNHRRNLEENRIALVQALLVKR